MRPSPGNDLNLGRLPGGSKSLVLSRTERDKHLYICGGTGVGKSKMLEHLIRQDIVKWPKNKCGLLVIDPHGSLYDGLINWAAWNNFDRPIIPIDLRQNDWIVSYNLLRRRPKADPAVLVDNLTRAIAYVWGQAGTNETPLFARWNGNVLGALYEKNWTLVEAEHLIDPAGKRIRSVMSASLKDARSRRDWNFANTLSAKDFEAQVGSTVNRLLRFIRNETLRATFGQAGVSLDFGRALDEGSIILVSLATEGARISNENAELFATLLLSDLWTAAQERGGKFKGVKPFYVYIDEFQRFVSPTISDNLDQARGFGLHMTMAHQFPNQLLDSGPNGRRLYNSIMETASSKVVFRLQHEENLRAMAQWLFMGVMNPDKVKHELYSTKVMAYREEMKRGYGFSRSSGTSLGTQRGSASGAGFGGTGVFDDNGVPSSTSRSWSEFSSESSSENETWSESMSESETLMPMLVPIIGKELSHVQFSSLEEQLFRAMAVLFDQRERQGVARVVGMNAPVSIYTPEVSTSPGSEKRTTRFLEKCYKKLPFVLSNADAQKQVSERAANFVETLFKQVADEPTTAKRRIR